MRCTVALCGISFFLTAGLGSTLAQTNPCEPLRPLKGSAQQYKNRGNRCEGLYQADYGTKALSLISFTIGALEYPLQTGTTLELTVPSQSETVRVRAIAKPPNVAYEMDALLSSGSTLVWPVSDVLLPENLGAKQIGVFAWKEKSNRQVFAPVRIIPRGSAHSDGGTVLLSLRPSFDVQVMKWRWAEPNGELCKAAGKWADVAQVPVDAGQVVSISLPPAKNLGCIDVAARGSGADWVTISLRVEMPRP
jgi:hypothetical protein